MVILANAAGNEIRRIDFKKADFDTNVTRDFEIRIPPAYFEEDLSAGSRIFVPGTEFGGLIGGIETDTATDEVILTGRTWRGALSMKVITPPQGEAYRIISGELNEILSQLVTLCGLSDLFSVSSESTGVTVDNFQFDRYVTLLSGIEKLLKAYGHRLSLSYQQGEKGEPGYVGIAAVPAQNLSEQIELSQDSRLDFSFQELKNGVNHLICLGAGDLTDRIVVDLYIQENGTVGTTPYYTGVDEIVATYEDVSADTAQKLREKGAERLLELSNGSNFKMGLTSLSLLGVDVGIGDIIGGRDYITGMSAAAPISNIIYREEAGVESIEYEIADGAADKASYGTAQQGGGGGNIIVDATLSDSSINPVQNRAITQRINAIDSTLATKAPNAVVTTLTNGLAPRLSGDSAQFLNGQGSWTVPPDTKYQEMTGATASSAGTAGLVPAPAAGDENKALKGDGTWGEVAGGVSGDTLPIGAIVEWSHETAPVNWLLLNGQAVSRTEYSELFELYGVNYGEGDGSTTFNLPDYRTRVPVGYSAGDDTFNTLGKTGGEKKHLLTTAEMPNHAHTLSAYYGTAAGGSAAMGSNSTGTPGTASTNAVGGSQAHNNIQPYIVTNFIIKAKQSAGLVANVVDNLTSTSTIDALSANQGRVLNNRIITPADYIIEYGELNGWYYEKWNSGKYVCKTIRTVSVSLSQQIGSVYVLTNGIGIATPITLTKVISFNLVAGGDGFLGGVRHIWATGGAIYGTPYYEGAGQYTFGVSAEVTGMWK